MGLKQDKEYIKNNKREIMMSIILLQNELQVLPTKGLSEWNTLQEEQRIMNGLIHLKETLFQINLKEYQIENRNK